MRNLFKIDINSSRIYGLDILRAFAIIFVVFGHGKHLLPHSLRPFIELFIFDGVSMFFVLSGFLIGGILIKLLLSKKVDLNLLFDFWIRRWFRTIPNYLFVLFLLVLCAIKMDDDFRFSSVTQYFYFSQNLFYPHPSHFFPEAWSLSVEEWFYLIIPVLIIIFIAVLRLSVKQSVFISAVCVLVAITVFRGLRFYNLDGDLVVWDLWFRKQVITRLDSLMFGVIGAGLQCFYKDLWDKFKSQFFVIGLVMILLLQMIIKIKLFPVYGLYNCVFSFSLFSLATLFLLPFLSSFKHEKTNFVYTTITYTSLISYSMYLINLSLVQKVVIANIDWSFAEGIPFLTTALQYLLYWVTVVLASILMYKYVEIPSMKLRDSQFIKRLLPVKHK